MQTKSVFIKLSLGAVGGLLAINLPGAIKVNVQPILAQPATFPCSLPAEIAVTFLESRCQEVTLEKPQTFYRYYSNRENQYGRYLTTEQYKTNGEAIRKLALKQAWGNQATLATAVTLPAGMIIYQGVAAPQVPTCCYPGGGQQTFIKDAKDPNINWSEGQKMVVENFSCP